MDYNNEWLDQAVAAVKATWKCRVALIMLQLWGVVVLAFAVHGPGKPWWVLSFILVSFGASLLLGSMLPKRPRGEHAPKYPTIQ